MGSIQETVMIRSLVVAFTGLAVACLPTDGFAGQQRDPEPFAAEGLPSVPLPESPIVFDTAEGQRIKVTVVAKGLTYPWEWRSSQTIGSSSLSALERFDSYVVVCSIRIRRPECQKSLPTQRSLA